MPIRARPTRQNYILHHRAVAARMKTEEEKTAALLHDVPKDTFVTEAALRNLFGDAVTNAVVTLPRLPEVPEADLRRAEKHLRYHVRLRSRRSFSSG